MVSHHGQTGNGKAMDCKTVDLERQNAWDDQDVKNK